jgi:hypothetical protein
MDFQNFLSCHLSCVYTFIILMSIYLESFYIENNEYQDAGIKTTLAWNSQLFLIPCRAVLLPELNTLCWCGSQHKCNLILNLQEDWAMQLEKTYKVISKEYLTIIL